MDRLSRLTVYEVIAHPARLKIIEYLMDKGYYLTIKDIMQAFPSEPRMAYHVSVLYKFGFLERKPDWKMWMYRLNHKPLIDALEEMVTKFSCLLRDLEFHARRLNVAYATS
ncbi:MAG: winged helix-turn-helix domain-containing protein [Candidatus Bathyarchaeota archaeon]|nr:winged helix-turn-helix domain-containing protein [Candidatus Bathyarchaeota archaeon]MDW8022411.1 winged helix-turn-helix domain-containing protein [Nitrososphaerota archaeon]